MDTRRSQISHFGSVGPSPTKKAAPLHTKGGGYKLTIEEMFKDKAMTFEDIDKLKYCRMVMQETLRLYTIIPFVNRTATRDVPLRNSNQVVPKVRSFGRSVVSTT